MKKARQPEAGASIVTVYVTSSTCTGGMDLYPVRSETAARQGWQQTEHGLDASTADGNSGARVLTSDQAPEHSMSGHRHHDHSHTDQSRRSACSVSAWYTLTCTA